MPPKKKIELSVHSLQTFAVAPDVTKDGYNLASMDHDVKKYVSMCRRIDMWNRLRRFFYTRVVRNSLDSHTPCTCSTSYSQDLTAVQMLIYALSTNIDHVPSNLSEERIITSLKRIAQGQSPDYHLKMRQRDVDELELYRKTLLQRQRLTARGCSHYLLQSASLF